MMGQKRQIEIFGKKINLVVFICIAAVLVAVIAVGYFATRSKYAEIDYATAVEKQFEYDKKPVQTSGYVTHIDNKGLLTISKEQKRFESIKPGEKHTTFFVSCTPQMLEEKGIAIGNFVTVYGEYRGYTDKTTSPFPLINAEKIEVTRN